MKKAVTIRDIAREAGVSSATVSRFLNRTGYVDQQTGARISEVVERFHYRPSRIAQSLKTKMSRNLVLVVPDIHDKRFSYEAAAAQAAAVFCGHGGIGRRAGFRFQCRKAYRFESCCPHQESKKV